MRPPAPLQPYMPYMPLQNNYAPLNAQVKYLGGGGAR